MLYFVNPASKGRKRQASKGKKKRKGPSRKQLAARRKFAAMARARARTAKKKKRATTRRKPAMATRKRKRTTTKRRRRTTAKRRSGVRLVRRGTTVYQGNPRRKRRGRRRYHRNPGIVAQLVGLAKDTGAVLVGGAVGRVASNVLPSFGNPIADAAKGFAIAIGVRMFGGKLVGNDMARLAAAGAAQVPLKNLIVGFVPQAATFLGDYEAQGALMGEYSDVSGYLDAGDMVEVAENMGSYSDV
jgi:hypothetical protein